MNSNLVFQNNCAICLSALKQNDKVIFNDCRSISKNDDRRKLLTNVFNAIAFKIFENESALIVEICNSCDELIENVLQFLEMCLQSQAILKSQEIKSEIVTADINSWSNIEQLQEYSDEKFYEVDYGSDEVPASELTGCEKIEVSSKFPCALCPKSFKSSSLLLNHSYLHSGDLPHGCPHCKEKFRSLLRLKMHISNFHSDVKVITCPLCRSAFGSNECLNEHHKKEHENEDYKCENCFEKFKDYHSFKSHQVKHSTNFVCQFCNETFESSSLWLKHSRNHARRRQYLCECGLVFKKLAKLKEHKAVFHEESDCFHCNDCGKKFSSKNKFTNHINVHRGLKPFVCNKCPLSYYHPSGLHQHYRLVHSTEHRPDPPRFLCDTCGNSFSRRAHLQRHLLRSHTPDAPRNFRCDHCNKCFKDKDSLKCHSKLHNEEKPFQCKDCKKFFRKRGAMQDHINRVHLNIRPYPCTNCKMEFKMKAHLEKHMRTHTGEKPYSCHLCQYSSAEKSNLQKHIKTHNRQNEE